MFCKTSTRLGRYCLSEEASGVVRDVHMCVSIFSSSTLGAHTLHPHSPSSLRCGIQGLKMMKDENFCPIPVGHGVLGFAYEALSGFYNAVPDFVEAHRRSQLARRWRGRSS